MPGAKSFNYCYPNHYRYAEDSVYRPYTSIESFLLSGDSSLIKYYNRSDLNIANATGTLLLIVELSHLQKQFKIQSSVETQVSILSKKQLITNRLAEVRTEIASIAAELDCEGERAEQLASYMSEKENARVNKLTVASITTGALSGVAAIFIKSPHTSDVVAVTGGLGSATLGLFSLTSSRKTHYMHPRNLLTDIWNEPETSSYYPPAIWFILTHKEFSNSQQYSICHNIRKRWREYNELGSIKATANSGQIHLLFGSGGIYTSDLLETRSDMLNQLQAAIRLLDQDILQLLYVVNR